MLKVLGLTLTVVMLLVTSSCSKDGGTNTPTPSGSPLAASSSPAASASPAASTLVATASPAASAVAAAPSTATVKISNFKFQDDASGTPVTTIKVGGTVTWTVTQGVHSLEGVAGSAANGCGNLESSFDSDNLTSGKSVSRTFNTVGTFGYHCGIHLGDPNCKTPPGTGRMPAVIKVVP